MKKNTVIIIFLLGLSIFSYPIISNLISAKEHYTMISEYNETLKKLEEEQIENEKKKADEHNEKMVKSEIDYVDPFSEDGQESSNQEKKSYYDALNIGSVMGNISIPKIKANLPIYHGTNEEVLSRGVGHLENSSLPSNKSGTHSVLTAHRGLPSSKLFRKLNKLTHGDTFTVQVLDEELTYEIHDIQVVLPHETDWLTMNEDENLMTLLTCEPYMINTHRMLVTGHLIDKKLVDYSQLEYKNNRSLLYIWVASLVGLIIIIGMIFWKYRKRGIEK